MQATGLQVLYKSALTSGRFSAEVKGRFSPAQALTLLLAPTGLTARDTTENAFTIIPTTSAPADKPDARWRADYDLYLGKAQSRIIAALCTGAATRPGGYRVALQFSIGRSGRIDEASLLDTTGDRIRDANILEALRGLPLGRAPPSDMPQPVTMLVAPRAAGLPNECRPND
jgi:hypothetical protein